MIPYPNFDVIYDRFTVSMDRVNYDNKGHILVRRTPRLVSFFGMIRIRMDKLIKNRRPPIQLFQFFA